MRQAKSESATVVSIFVNPTQFNDKSDLEKYPRDLARDMALCESVGADIIFAPEPEEMYPAGFRATVAVEGPLTFRKS